MSDAAAWTDKLKRMALFAEIVDSGSISAAARRVGSTPSAVSQQLRSLHQAYGRPLVQRTQRGIRLTRDGQRVLGALKRVLNVLRVLAEQLSAYRGETSGRLHLGVLPMASTALAPQALAALLRG